MFLSFIDPAQKQKRKKWRNISKTLQENSTRQSDYEPSGKEGGLGTFVPGTQHRVTERRGVGRGAPKTCLFHVIPEATGILGNRILYLAQAVSSVEMGTKGWKSHRPTDNSR